MKEIDEEAKRKLVKKRTKIAAIVAILLFSVFATHLYVAYDSIVYFENLFNGDVITIVSTVLVSWALIGWFILFRTFRNIP
ncbi:MAG: hypothetical protein ABUK01_12450 [Leptospirales bacterium]